ncbi:MAG: histone H1/H5 family protein [Asgard group archaeon]|nr:histone H1/H5 family protein [Asgard group archaeon]
MSFISSRQALKKYVQSNYDVKTSNFDSLFNTALRKAVASGDFLQPKGPSGPVKLAKKEKPATTKVSKPASKEGKAAAKPKAKKAEKSEKTEKAEKTEKKAAAPKKTKAATKAKSTTTKAKAGKVTKPAKKAATTKKAAAKKDAAAKK